MVAELLEPDRQVLCEASRASTRADLKQNEIQAESCDAHDAGSRRDGFLSARVRHAVLELGLSGFDHSRLDNGLDRRAAGAYHAFDVAVRHVSGYDGRIPCGGFVLSRYRYS